MTGQTIILATNEQRRLAAQLVFKAPDRAICNIRQATRTTPQNSKMWAMLSDVSRAKPEGRDMRSEQWKAAFMSALGHEVKWMNGIDGNPPFPDQHRTSKLNKDEMADLITFIQEYGDRNGVVWQAT